MAPRHISPRRRRPERVRGTLYPKGPRPRFGNGLNENDAGSQRATRNRANAPSRQSEDDQSSLCFRSAVPCSSLLLLARLFLPAKEASKDSLDRLPRFFSGCGWLVLVFVLLLQ